MLAADRAGRYWPREGSSALHHSAYEGGLVAARVHFVEGFRLESADVEQELKLVAKVRSHHLGPEMMRTHLRDELQLLLDVGALQPETLHEVNARGHQAA